MMEDMLPIYKRNSDCLGIQDDALIAISYGQVVTVDMLAKLPPWRASMINRIAWKANSRQARSTPSPQAVHALAGKHGGDCPLDIWAAALKELPKGPVVNPSENSKS